MHSHGEPTLVTDPALTNVLEDLRTREPIFHHPEFGTTLADFDSMMVADFWEVGASGRRYSREYVLAELQRRVADGNLDEKLETSEFHCRKLSQDVYLLTYTLMQSERKTRRATIWQRTETGWKIVFHQGTIVQDP